MADTVRVDAAALRAAIGDDRYWQAAHPEHTPWRSWVTDGFKALYNEGRAEGGVVHVGAYMRDGHMVSAHTRSAPPRQEATERSGPAEAGAVVEGVPADPFGTTAFAFGMRRSLLDPQHVTPVARRPDQRRIPSGEIPTPMDGMRGGPPGAGLGSGGGPSSTAPRPPAVPPTVTPRNQQLVDILAPEGVPIGVIRKGPTPDIRTLPGGDTAAQAMFRRLTEGRIEDVITPPGHQGTMVRLHDGAVIGFRPTSSTSRPAVDINIPGFSLITKLHF